VDRALGEEFVVGGAELRGHFEERQGASREDAETPVAARSHESLLTILGKITARAPGHPDRRRDRLIEAVDVPAEQTARQKIQGSIVGAGLPCGQQIVSAQALVDLRTAPSAAQKIANHARTRQQPKQPAAPAGAA